MATIAEKQADTGTLIDDLASTMTGHSSGNWVDADTDITNGGGDNAWENNGRVIEHTPSGQFILMWVTDNGLSDTVTGGAGRGVGVVISNGWDSTNDHPSGNTTVGGQEPFAGSVGNDRYDSHSNINVNTTNSYVDGILYFDGNGGDRQTNRTDPVTYRLSVGPDYFNVAAWNTTDGNNGGACITSWEYVDNKFWNDGNDPWAWTTMMNWSGSGSTEMYGWSHYYAENNVIDAENPYGAHEYGFDGGMWGTVNPDSNDDSFFFRRPVIYQTNGKDVPVAYAETAISNDLQEGGAHGDVVTHNTNDFQFAVKSGAGTTTTLSWGLLHQ